MLRVTNNEYWMFQHGPKIWLFDTLKDLAKFFLPYVIDKSHDWKEHNIHKIKKRGNKWEMIQDDKFYLEIIYQGEKLGIYKKIKKKKV